MIANFFILKLNRQIYDIDTILEKKTIKKNKLILFVCVDSNFNLT
jgi:hypothetical protein